MILNAIYSRLSQSAELAAVVGDKIYAVNVPEEDVAPAIAFNAVTTPMQTTSGYANSEDNAEIMVLAKEYDQGAYLAQEVAKLFYSYGYNQDGVIVYHSKVDLISRAYNDLFKEHLFIINITLKSKII